MTSPDTLTALRADYEALGKRIAELEKKPEPCPLEEGKEVRIDTLSTKDLTDWIHEDIGFDPTVILSVKKTDGGEWATTIQVPFGSDLGAKPYALQHAVALLNRTGGSSD